MTAEPVKRSLDVIVIDGGQALFDLSAGLCVQGRQGFTFFRARRRQGAVNDLEATDGTKAEIAIDALQQDRLKMDDLGGQCAVRQHQIQNPRLLAVAGKGDAIRDTVAADQLAGDGRPFVDDGGVDKARDGAAQRLRARLADVGCRSLGRF